jgi:hypothetical protein
MAGDLSRTGPHPSLSPKEVVTIIMKALQQNDLPNPDSGIKVTFNFASPANKRATGPLARFTLMVKGPVYGTMINHRRVFFEKYKVDGKSARIDVILVSSSGKTLGFRFGLSRQIGNRFDGSWMTDTVAPIKVVTL